MDQLLYYYNQYTFAVKSLPVHLRGTPKKRPVTESPVKKHQVTKRPVTERLGYKMSRIQNVDLPNVRFQNVQDTKRPGHKTFSFL